MISLLLLLLTLMTGLNEAQYDDAFDSVQLLTGYFSNYGREWYKINKLIEIN